MSWRFTKHYTREEARALLPQVRDWLRRLRERQQLREHVEGELGRLLDHGHDLGGDGPNHLVRTVAAIEETLGEVHRHGLQIKDLGRGLVDFPALVGGREVFLCWEEGEEDVEYWHDLDAGYRGREPL
jgi:hypothetical protein